MKPYLQRLMEHMHWANGRTLASLREITPPPDAVRMFVHVLTAERLYHERMVGADPFPQDFWPEMPLEWCAGAAEANFQLYKRLLWKITEEQLQQRVRYRNSKGTYFETPVWELMTQVGLHGEHHRGQIARMVREAGGKAALTDFIVFVRQYSPGEYAP